MLKRLVTFACLLWILDPSASAQSAARPAPIAAYSDDVAFQNLCIPDLVDGLYEETEAIALDEDQLAKLRIGLLERGWVPGFDLDAIDAEVQLAEAIRGFQAENSLPVTGQADAATLFMLGVSIETPSDGAI